MALSDSKPASPSAKQATPGTTPASPGTNPASPNSKPKVAPTLLTLPPEIRNYIYDLAIFNIPFTGAPRPTQLITIGDSPNCSGFSDYPPRFNSTISLKKNVGFVFSEQGLEYPEDESPYSTPHNLFSICRQTRKETRETYYACNTFVFRMTPAGVSTFLDWLDAIGQDARGFLQTLMPIFTLSGQEMMTNQKEDARVFLLDFAVKNQPRVIMPFQLSFKPDELHPPVKPGAFQTAIKSLPVLKFLMNDSGCSGVIKHPVRVLDSHAHIEDLLYRLWCCGVELHGPYFPVEYQELMENALTRSDHAQLSRWKKKFQKALK